MSLKEALALLRMYTPMRGDILQALVRVCAAAASTLPKEQPMSCWEVRYLIRINDKWKPGCVVFDTPMEASHYADTMRQMRNEYTNVRVEGPVIWQTPSKPREPAEPGYEGPNEPSAEMIYDGVVAHRHRLGTDAEKIGAAYNAMEAARIREETR